MTQNQTEMKKFLFTLAALLIGALAFAQNAKNNTADSIVGKYLIEKENSKVEFVKNADGTPYVFKPHDLRHWMAKQMYDENIPAQFIQEQLHHASPEMTMAYVEFMNRRKAEKMRKFVDMNGKESPIAPMDDRKCADDWHYADYVSKNMNVTVLPNGLCTRPKKLGPCGSANSCLTCPEFRTSMEDLQTHKDHLERLDVFIRTADKNGWADQAKESRIIREHLKRIICALEENGGV